ncbi:MAG: sensor histidine kinase [Pyrinomonadaceae bacterium]
MNTLLKERKKLFTAAATNPDATSVEWACRLARVLGLLVFLGGLAGFLGWALDIQSLADWNNEGIAIQPNNTVCMMLGGVAVILIAYGRGHVGVYFGIIAGAIGFATFSQYLHGVDLGIDRLLLFGRDWGSKATVAPGRMGPPASFSWTLLLCAFLLLTRKGRLRSFVPVFLIAVLVITSVSFVGYLMGADPLYTLPRFTAIAWQTSAMFIALAIGMLAALNDLTPVRLVVEDSVTGMLLRRLLIPVVVIPLALGSLRVAGQDAGLFDTAMGTALLQIILIGIFLLIIFIVAANASIFEAARRKSDEAAKAAAVALAELNRDLEDRVTARTEALSIANVALADEMHARVKAEKERIAVLGRMMTAQEEERRRIAAELHDQLGQHMTALRLRLKALHNQAGDNGLAAPIDQIIEIAEDLDQDIDGITASLRPRSLDTLGLSEALGQYVATWQKQSGIISEFHAHGYCEGQIPDEAETALFRITQEALHNCAKHSAAGFVSVLLNCRENRVSLVIEDDGCGFDSETQESDGLGLTSMRERCELVGGELTIESENSSGTTILITIPIKEAKNSNEKFRAKV